MGKQPNDHTLFLTCENSFDHKSTVIIELKFKHIYLFLNLNTDGNLTDPWPV